jgi:hypothetical protein
MRVRPIKDFIGILKVLRLKVVGVVIATLHGQHFLKIGCPVSRLVGGIKSGEGSPGWLAGLGELDLSRSVHAREDDPLGLQVSVVHHLDVLDLVLDILSLVVVVEGLVQPQTNLKEVGLFFSGPLDVLGLNVVKNVLDDI